MSLCYFVLVQRVDSGKIRRVYCADLGLSIENEQLEGVERGLNRFVQAKILDHINDRERQGRFIPDPKGASQYRRTRLKSNDTLMFVFIDKELNRGPFARLLPRLSTFSFVFAEACSTVVSIASMEVAGTGWKGLKVLSAFTFGISGLIMYFYSRSGYTMSRMGIKLDNLLYRRRPERQILPPEEMPAPRRCSANSTKIICSQMLLAGLLLTNIIISNISGYEGLDSLGKQAKEKNSMVPEDLFNFAKWILVTLGSISALSFVGSFFDDFSTDLTQRFSSHPPGDEPEAFPLVDLEAPSSDEEEEKYEDEKKFEP